MPTDLFVRRPLLWLQVASKKRVTHHLLARISAIAISSRCWAIGGWKMSICPRIRSIYNGAEPISVELCNEFMQALAYTGLKHQRDVSGLRLGGGLPRRHASRSRIRTTAGYASIGTSSASVAASR